MDRKFDWEGGLENKGAKPIRIREMFMDVGHPRDKERQYHQLIGRDFFIAADEKRPIEFRKSANEIRKDMEQLNSEECTFTLRVSYEDSLGKLREGRYPFGGFGKGGSLILIIGIGEALMSP